MSLDELPQYAVVQKLQDAFQADERIKAAWLAGSLGRGAADRYADIDLHLWLSAEDKDAFRAGYPEQLSKIYPVLSYKELFGGNMIVATLSDGNLGVMAFDTFVETEPPKLTEGKARILFDREEQLELLPATAIEPKELVHFFNEEVSYFWRLFAMLPSIRRDELIPAFYRLGIHAGQLANTLTLGRGRPRDVGEKRMNELLTPDEQHELEQALALGQLTQASLTRAHMKLATMMSQRGRLAAQNIGANYPEELEQAVLSYIQKELGVTNEVQP